MLELIFVHDSRFLFCRRCLVCRERFIFYQSQNFFLATEYWYIKHCWKKPLLNTDKQFETHFRLKPLAWTLPWRPPPSEFHLWKMICMRRHPLSFLRRDPHGPITPVTANKSESSSHWNPNELNTVGRTSSLKAKSASEYSREEWRMWNSLTMFLTLESQ